MAQIIEIQNTDDPRDVIHQAVHLLAEGKLVAFPTETVYVVVGQGLQSGAVQRLHSLGGNCSKPPPVLALKGAEEVWDYIPGLSGLGKKLSRRCWPGPVTLAFDADPDNGLLRELPAETRHALISGGHINVRVPSHKWISEALRLTPAPLVLSGESFPDVPAARTASDILAQFGEAIDMVIDDGPCHYGQPSTVVRVQDDNWEILQPGVVAETALRRLASEVYVFVCTGNTCRSPMAEGLFRRLLSEKLQCTEEELVDRGFVVASAGVAATVGAPANPEAVATMEKLGIDLRSHESYPLTGRLLDQADHLLTMTQSHREMILMDRPDLADRVIVLSRDGCDIPDPFGGSSEEYEVCRQEIERHIRAIIAEIPVR